MPGRPTGAGGGAEGYRIDLRTKVLTPFWQTLLDDLEHGVPAAVIAVRFHRGFGHAVVNMARLLFETEGDKLEPIVALSGGSFQNRLLLGHSEPRLAGHGLTVLTHARSSRQRRRAIARPGGDRERPEASSLNKGRAERLQSCA